MPAVVRTTCPYCGVGCGVVARELAQGAFEISGDLRHPANWGSLCSKGAALAETLGTEGRLLHPLVREGRGPHRAVAQRVGWDQALSRVARGFSAAIREHGPDSVAFYASGQLLTEDYYVANKLMKGIHRAAHIVNERLEACAYFSRRPDLPARRWLSSLFAHERLQGADRIALIAGRPLRAGNDAGPLVCACFAVGRNALSRLIVSEGLTDARQVGERIRAGTRCGSCLPEIRKLIATGLEGV